MKILDGGTTEHLQGKIETIVIKAITDNRNMSFELWINGDSLSYVTLSELINLRDEINTELKKMLQI